MYERRVRIVAVAITPTEGVGLPLVLHRITIENLANTRTRVDMVGCQDDYRESDIALAPHERRTFAFTRPADLAERLPAAPDPTVI